MCPITLQLSFRRDSTKQIGWARSSRRCVRLWYIHLRGQSVQTDKHFKCVHVQQVICIEITPNFSITICYFENVLFWDFTQRRPVVPYRRFGTTHASWKSQNGADLMRAAAEAWNHAYVRLINFFSNISSIHNGTTIKDNPKMWIFDISIKTATFLWVGLNIHCKVLPKHAICV